MLWVKPCACPMEMLSEVTIYDPGPHQEEIVRERWMKKIAM